MRALFRALTTRGRWFVAAGLVAIACGLLIPESDLVRIGLLLLMLPLLSCASAGRSRYRLSCTRRVTPARVQVGQPAELTIRLSNVSRLRTGLLLAEDMLPYRLGKRPRFVLDAIGGGGTREFRYQVRSRARGKYVIGPLQVRVADSFGLVEINRAFTSMSTLTVTPQIVPLTRPPLAGSWLGDSDDGRRSISASGDDDAIPRPYQTGDGLRRVHWRSTARHGELMVRREEQHWRNTATLFLDTRHAAYGTTPLFELAVTAAASIGVHLAGEGFDARLVTDAGDVPRQGSFRDTLLDTLAVIRASRHLHLRSGISALSAGGGQVIAVLGLLSAAEARELAVTRQGRAPALALLLAPGTPGGDRDQAMAAKLLAGAGWRAAVVTADTQLAQAWQQLHRRDGTRAGPASGAAADPVVSQVVSPTVSAVSTATEAASAPRETSGARAAES